MQKTLYILSFLIVFAQPYVYGQRKCGYELQKAALFSKYPDAAERFTKQKASVIAAAEQYKALKASAAYKTTAASPVPVVFHVIVSSAQYIQLGGHDGIARRCDSQIAVMNRDFNKANGDSAFIPAGFKPLYGSANIQFALAHVTPWGWATPGYDVKIIDASGFDGAFDSYADAKHDATNGVTAWDVSKYLNIWCINFNDIPGLIGITLAKSLVGTGAGAADEIGVCLLYNVFGKRVSASDVYPANFDQGRTLTHELGHFFEIWHTWGDDGGLCPGAGGVDDSIADTPPQADATAGTPTAPMFDVCSSSGNGIMWMNFMDYCNDNALHMFTSEQCSVMHSQVDAGGGLATLTTHPELLVYPPYAGIEERESQSIEVFPNPASGVINIAWDNRAGAPEYVTLMNAAGQEVKTLENSGKELLSIDISGISKGIYFVRCTFAGGSVMRKILIQ
jgi:hypothetical protein